MSSQEQLTSKKAPAPLTSVLICTHNMGQTLERTLASVRIQEGRWECLVLDDGSTDGTWDKLRSLFFPGLHLFRFKVRRGLTYGRNFLLERARGEFISIADADDWLFPQKVVRHAALLNSAPRAGVVWGRATIEVDDNLCTVMPAFGYQHGWDLCTDYSVVHSASTWRKNAIVQAGGYDPHWTAVEAVDLFLRVGDHWEQLFDATFAAHKGLHPNNRFRSFLKEEGARLSRALAQRTLERRYPRLKASPHLFPG